MITANPTTQHLAASHFSGSFAPCPSGFALDFPILGEGETLVSADPSFRVGHEIAAGERMAHCDDEARRAGDSIGFGIVITLG